MSPLTHYFPWNESEFAFCGFRISAADIHSGEPTCPVCRAHLELERLIDEEQVPLDAEEADRELDPLLNAGLPVRTPMSPLGAELFALANTLALLTLTRTQGGQS